MNSVCGDCGAPGSSDDAGTVCSECHRGIMVTDDYILWIVDESSLSYDWLAVGRTEAEALRAFKRTWNDWCEKTGADPYYWGEQGDKWSSISARPVIAGRCYMDRELYR